jgi:UDP-glucuronate 4-epimerase
MKVLITGAAGFVGGNLLSRLRDENIEAVGIDSFSTYYSPAMKKARLIALGISNSIINLDTCDRETVEKLFVNFRPEVVVHLAAQGGVRASRTQPMPYIMTNQMGYLNMLELSAKHEVARFIYASSSSVYGDDAIAPFSESATLNAPKSLYALSKLSNEIVSANFPNSEMQRIGLRLFTVYGPWGRPDMAMFRLLASCKLEERFQLTANLDVLRDFTFVDDTTLCMVELIKGQAMPSQNEILNIAGGRPYSLANLLKILNSHNLAPEIDFLAQDPLDVKRTHGSTKKCEKLGLSIPNTKLEDGVGKTINWVNSLSKDELREWYEYSK